MKKEDATTNPKPVLNGLDEVLILVPGSFGVVEASSFIGTFGSVLIVGVGSFIDTSVTVGGSGIVWIVGPIVFELETVKSLLIVELLGL